MAARKPKQQSNPLTALQREQIRNLYVYGLAEAQEIAVDLGLGLHAVKAAVKPLLAVRRRLWGSPEVQAKTEAATAEMAERRARMEIKCAVLAEARIDAQTTTAAKLNIQAIEAKNPEEVRAVARALGPAAPDITSGRLSVGLNTEKTETTHSEVAQALHAVATALDRAEGLDDPDAGRAGGDAGGPGVDSPRGPEAGSS